MRHYADTSFIASLYLPGDGCYARACAIAETLPEDDSLPLTPFGMLELCNVFARLEWKGLLRRAESEALLREVKNDIATGFFSAEPLLAYAWMQAGIEVVRSVTPRTGTRTLDALHLAQARLHGATAFISFDANQRRAAAEAGFELVPSAKV